MKQQPEPAFRSSHTTHQPDTACKILPFRKPHSGRPHGDEPVYDSVAVEPADDYFLEEKGSFLTACPPAHPDATSCHGWAWGRDESRADTPHRARKWLKKVLLGSVFAAWTAAAIAISIALG